MPNILFILMDDLGWRDLTCYGSDFYETQNLDRLASEGMFFTDAYASCPVCSPTRASILTGKYPARVGVTQYIGGYAVGKLCDVPYFHNLPLSEYSLASALRDGGYQTWHVGKWHLGGHPTLPTKHGFEVNVGGCEWGEPVNGYFSPWNIPGLENGKDDEYLTDYLTDKAIELIKNRDKQKPFFLNMWHYAVHGPIQSPPELVEKYRKKAKRLGLDKKQTFEEGDYFPCEHKKNMRIKRRLLQSDPEYAAMVENMDANIGKLLGVLKAEGLEEDTIVVFTSDNGGLSTAEGSPTCNSPLAEGKGWMCEGGIREPLLIKWPGRIEAGSLCSEPVSSTDFYPTFLDAAQLPLLPEQHCDGISLMPLFERKPIDREALFWHYPHYSNQGGSPACSVRRGDWKLIKYFEDGRFELYNLKDDIGEEDNKIDEENALANKLKTMLDDWVISIEALLPRANPLYKH